MGLRTNFEAKKSRHGVKCIEKVARTSGKKFSSIWNPTDT